MSRVEQIGRATLSGIYSITNRVNGKVYVGSAVNIQKRWTQHRCDLRAKRHHTPKLQAAWNKYGPDAFEFAVLEVVAEPSDVVAREQHWLDTLRPWDAGYNTDRVAGSRLGSAHSEGARAKLKAARNRRPSMPCSEETKLKLSLAQKGRKRKDYGPEYRALMSSIMRGRPGRPQSQATRDKLAQANLGKKHSEETRVKMAASHRARREKADA